MEALIALAFWVALWGTLGALIAPRKGQPPSYGFVVAGLFSIFGLAYLALKPDAGPGQRLAGTTRKTFTAKTRERAEAAYQADLPAARQAGYVPWGRRWLDGPEAVLEVIYRPLTPPPA